MSLSLLIDHDNENEFIKYLMETVDVLIVGGGAAGLGAAKTLGSKINYLLIEAQNYLGGRIFTVDAAENVVVDLGAQFIHGETNNIVYEICHQLNCILSHTDRTNNDMLVISSDRTKIDCEQMRKAMTIWEEMLREAQNQFGNKTISMNYSLSDYLIKRFQQRLLSSLPFSENLVDALVDYFYQTELIENGCFTLSNLSLAEYGSFQYLNGIPEIEFINGGYRPFITYMKSFIPDDNRIRLNREVIRVKYLNENHQLLVDIRHNDNNTKTSKISQILCNHIIWTSSLGYLKENFSSIFSNEIELIQQKQSAIDNLGFDAINKVVMIYEKRFWPKNTKEIILLHTHKPITIELTETGKIDTKTKNIIVETIHRYDVLPSTDVPVLICWLGGSAALLSEDFNEEIIGELCHKVLCYYLNIPSELNKLTRVIKSEWHKNRFTRGSYSYFSIKSTMKDAEDLRMTYAPDGIPRIQFAGEATHEKFYSTVHGALESGIREGNKLLKIINK